MKYVSPIEKITIDCGANKKLSLEMLGVLIKDDFIPIIDAILSDAETLSCVNNACTSISGKYSVCYDSYVGEFSIIDNMDVPELDSDVKENIVIYGCFLFDGINGELSDEFDSTSQCSFNFAQLEQAINLI